MFDIGWSELLLIAVVTLIVVGPEELPGLLRKVGRFVRLIQTQAAQFRAQIDDAIRDTELADVRDEMRDLRDDVKNTVSGAQDSVKSNLDVAKSVLSGAGRAPAVADESVDTSTQLGGAQSGPKKPADGVDGSGKRGETAADKPRPEGEKA